MSSARTIVAPSMYRCSSHRSPRRGRDRGGGEEVLAAGVAPRRYRHGEVVVGQGQAVTCLRLVVSGAIRLSAVVPSGRESVVGLLGAGNGFGALAPPRGAPRLRGLARSHGTAAADGVRLPPRLTQEELARMVGATRESVNRTLSSLAARGLVRGEGGRHGVPGPAALA